MPEQSKEEKNWPKISANRTSGLTSAASVRHVAMSSERKKKVRGSHFVSFSGLVNRFKLLMLHLSDKEFLPKYHQVPWVQDLNKHLWHLTSGKNNVLVPKGAVLCRVDKRP